MPIRKNLETYRMRLVLSYLNIYDAKQIKYDASKLYIEDMAA